MAGVPGFIDCEPVLLGFLDHVLDLPKGFLPLDPAVHKPKQNISAGSGTNEFVEFLLTRNCFKYLRIIPK